MKLTRTQVLRGIATLVSGALLIVSTGALHGSTEVVADAILVCVATILGAMGQPVSLPDGKAGAVTQTATSEGSEAK